MDELAKVANQLEYIFLKRLAIGIKGNIIDIPTAKNLATLFLQIEPFTSVDDAKQKMQQFSIQNSYFELLKDYIEAYYSEQHKDAAIEQMRVHIKEGNLDKALQSIK